jgi:hypothetical protein
MMDCKKYKHGCDKCVFLGNFVDSDFLEYDLYVHWDDNEKTVIARYSSDKHEYISGLPLAAHIPALNEALFRAIELKHVPPNIAMPLSVRRAFYDNDTMAAQFVSSLKRKWSRYLNESYTPRTISLLREAVRQSWSAYYTRGIVNVPTRKMPEFEVTEHEGIVSFGWVDTEIGVSC